MVSTPSLTVATGLAAGVRVKRARAKPLVVVVVTESAHAGPAPKSVPAIRQSAAVAANGPGRCWRFADFWSCDAALIPLRFANCA